MIAEGCAVSNNGSGLNITLVIFMLEHRYYPVNLSLNKPELKLPVLNQNCDPTGFGGSPKLKVDISWQNSNLFFEIFIP